MSCAFWLRGQWWARGQVEEAEAWRQERDALAEQLSAAKEAVGEQVPVEIYFTCKVLCRLITGRALVYFEKRQCSYRSEEKLNSFWC